MKTSYLLDWFLTSFKAFILHSSGVSDENKNGFFLPFRKLKIALAVNRDEQLTLIFSSLSSSVFIKKFLFSLWIILFFI